MNSPELSRPGDSDVLDECASDGGVLMKEFNPYAVAQTFLPGKLMDRGTTPESFTQEELSGLRAKMFALLAKQPNSEDQMDAVARFDARMLVSYARARLRKVA